VQDGLLQILSPMLLSYWAPATRRKRVSLSQCFCVVLDGLAEARIRLGLELFKLRPSSNLKRLHVRGASALVKGQAIFGTDSRADERAGVVVDARRVFEDETALLGKVGDDIHVAATRMRKAIGQDGAQRRRGVAARASHIEWGAQLLRASVPGHQRGSLRRASVQ